MKPFQHIILPLTAGLGLLAGGVAGYLKQSRQQGEAHTENNSALFSEENIATDAFSIKLFQQALADRRGNILVAPHVVSRTLSHLEILAGGKTNEALQALQLHPSAPPRAAEPASISLLAVDINVPRLDTGSEIISLPFSENVPLALSIFNGAIARFMGRNNAQYATSEMVTGRTKLLAGAVCSFQAKWDIGFQLNHSRTADFESASGSLPQFTQMRSRGNYRMAQADDGSWKAIALQMRSDPLVKSSPMVLIGVLPSGSARDFAAGLTPETVDEIRKKLATATPEDTLVEFPRLELEVRPYDMRATLRRMELKSLFDSDTSDFSALTPEKIHLGAFVHASEIKLRESKETGVSPHHDLDSAKNYISFSRPFLWFVTDLSSATPIDFIGLIEEM